MQLTKTALEQAVELLRGSQEHSHLLSSVKNAAFATDNERLQEAGDRFHEHVDHMQEVR